MRSTKRGKARSAGDVRIRLVADIHGWGASLETIPLFGDFFSLNLPVVPLDLSFYPLGNPKIEACSKPSSKDVSLAL